MVMNIFSRCVFYAMLMLYCIPQKTLHHSLMKNYWCFIVLSHRDGHFFPPCFELFRIFYLSISLWNLIPFIMSRKPISSSSIAYLTKSHVILFLYTIFIDPPKHKLIFSRSNHQVMLIGVCTYFENVMPCISFQNHKFIVSVIVGWQRL